MTVIALVPNSNANNGRIDLTLGFSGVQSSQLEKKALDWVLRALSPLKDRKTLVLKASVDKNAQRMRIVTVVREAVGECGSGYSPLGNDQLGDEVHTFGARKDGSGCGYGDRRGFRVDVRLGFYQQVEHCWVQGHIVPLASCTRCADDRLQFSQVRYRDIARACRLID